MAEVMAAAMTEWKCNVKLLPTELLILYGKKTGNMVF